MIQVIQEHDGGALVQRLADDLRRRPPAPLEEEIVIVESLGMARYLPLELARRLGGMARLATPFPARFVWERLLRPANPGLAADSPWESGALAWRLAAILAGGASHGPAARLLQDDSDGRLRHELSHRLATLFDQYLVYRPGMLLDWEQLPHLGLPGALKGPPASVALAWQKDLWLELGRQIREPHRALLLARWLQCMRADDAPPGLERLPRRLSLFGLHGLPPVHLAVFDALSRRIETRVYLLNPSHEYWGDLPRRFRREDPIDPALAPLLQANGAELGMWIDQLLEAGAEFSDPAAPPGPVTLLDRVRHSLAELEPMPPLTVDGSLQFHSCHSLARQAEVMVDRLLDLLERHPDLTPGDVLILCPDPETARPALEAVLDTQEEGRRLPWRMLGSSTRHGVARALEQTLDLAGGRWESGSVLAPLSCPALRRRLGMEADQLPRLLDWCRDTGVRWGWDAEDRRRLDLPALDEHGWRAGLDRLLLGYAMSSAVPAAGLIPHVPAGEDHALLESWLRWISLLRAFQEEALQDRTPADWFAWLAAWLPRCFSPDDDEEEELQWIREGLLEAERDARLGQGMERISLAAGRVALRGAIQPGVGIRGGGFDGRMTVAPMLAGRGLPAAVIVLLGMEDQVFPRPGRRDELDLCLGPVLPGDRQPRLQDRGQFLDAICAARRALLIFWNGRDERENARRPPSVVVSELLDLLGGRQGLVLEHALDGCNTRCFTGAIDERSFHQARGRGAARLQELRRRPALARLPGPAFVDPLSLPAPGDALTLEELTRFFSNPARALLTRAGVRLPWDAQPLAAHEPFSCDRQTAGRIRRLVLEWRRGGVDPGQDEARLRAAGLLPWGRPGRAALEVVHDDLDRALRQEAEALGGMRTTSRELSLELEGMRLEGTLEVAGERRVELHLRDTPRAIPFASWIRHLAWCHLAEEAADVGGPVSLLVFRDKVLRLEPVPAAGGSLARVLARWREGQDRWLPWIPLVSEAIALHGLRVDAPDPAMLEDVDWFDRLEFVRDDPWLRLILGEADPFTHPALAPRVLELALELGGMLPEARA